MGIEGEFNYTNGALIESSIAEERKDAVCRHEEEHGILYTTTTFGQRVFSFTKKDMDEIEEEQKKEKLKRADWMFEEQWESFIRDYSETIIREIKSDENYLAVAEEKGRSIQNIEKRKKTLEKNKKRLEQEYKKAGLIASYVEMYEKGQVDFEYKNEVCYDIFTEKYSIEVVKIMKFDNGNIFIPDAICIGEACIKNKDGQVIIGNRM